MALVDFSDESPVSDGIDRSMISKKWKQGESHEEGSIVFDAKKADAKRCSVKEQK